jgi:hypothetical protein
VAFLSINTTVTGTFLTDAEVNAALHLHSPELATDELQRVRDRTPYLTGALRSAAEARSYQGATSRQLVKIWYSDEPQLFEWNRVYVAYQEGPPLGLSTYTNPPRLMLQQAPAVDTPAIQAWADQVVADTEASLPLLDGITLDEFIAHMGTL